MRPVDLDLTEPAIPFRVRCVLNDQMTPQVAGARPGLAASSSRTATSICRAAGIVSGRVKRRSVIDLLGLLHRDLREPLPLVLGPDVRDEVQHIEKRVAQVALTHAG